MRQQFLHQLVRGPAVVRALALDQRDRARQHRAVTGADAPDKIGRRQVARSHRIPQAPGMIMLARGFCNAVRKAKHKAALTPFALGCGAAKTYS